MNQHQRNDNQTERADDPHFAGIGDKTFQIFLHQIARTWGEIVVNESFNLSSGFLKKRKNGKHRENHHNQWHSSKHCVVGQIACRDRNLVLPYSLGKNTKEKPNVGFHF